MEQNLFNQNQPQPIYPSNWYTTQQVANGFECSQEAIRMCKSRNANQLIEGIHWKLEPVTTVTGSKIANIWSEAGIMKLAELMEKTEKAQDFVVEMRVQEELKKRMVKLPDFNNPIAAARAWADECEAKTKALQLIEEQKPKVEFADKVNFSKNGVDINTFAKSINWKPNLLFEWLRKNGYLYYQNSYNVPYQKHVIAGYFSVKTIILDSGLQYPKVLITGSGQIHLSKKINEVSK